MSDNNNDNIDDVCTKLVRYCRSCVVGNEQQALALFLAGVTAFAPRVKEYAPVIVLGELSSGKTHLVRAVFGDEVEEGIEAEFLGLFPDGSTWHFTSGSDKAPIYASELRDLDNDIKIVVAAELKKLPPPIVEYFKSMSGDDPVFKYVVTNMASKDADTILQKKRWFCVTYAQKDIDPELASRMLAMTVEENKWITQCVIELNHGAESVFYPVTKLTYKNEIDLGLADEIRNELEIIAMDPVSVVNPFAKALKHFEDNSRASSKRVSRMTEALFKSSARVNHANRAHKNGKVVMSQQDVVNVLSFSEIVQGMVLGIDTIDLAIVRYLGIVRHQVKEEEIIARIDDSGLAELKLDELHARLRNLANNNYIMSRFDDVEKCVKWRYNPRKFIHRLTIHWEEIAVIEGLHPVTDPVTDRTFPDILQYGIWFDLENSRGLEFQEVSSVEEENTLENRIRMTVSRMLASNTRYNDTHALITDCRIELKMTGLESWGHEADVNAIIEAMVRENAIAMNDKLGCLVMIDESCRVSSV